MRPGHSFWDLVEDLGVSDHTCDWVVALLWRYKLKDFLRKGSRSEEVGRQLGDGLRGRIIL